MAAVENLKDKWSGRRCFITATGQSISDQDMSKLDGEAVIGCNMSFLTVRPEYHCVSDNGMWDRNKKMMLSEPFVKVVCACKNVPERDDVVNLHRTPTEQKKLYRKQKQFSRNLEALHYSPSVVTTLCIPLAWHMGVRKIYLLGCDFTRGHFYGDSDGVDKHEHRDALAFHGSKWKLKYWKRARELFALDGGVIYNASPVGDVDLFDRVDYGSLF